MKTKTTESQAAPKEDRRLGYQLPRQDHGTKGERQIGRGRDYYGKTATEIKDRDIQRAANDEVLNTLSSKQLEKLASSILTAAGFEEPDLDISFMPTGDETTWNSDNWDRKQEERAWATQEDIDNEMSEEDSADSFIRDLGLQRAEFTGEQQRRRSLMTNAERVYEGHINQDDDLGDYTDGFHIVDRP